MEQDVAEAKIEASASPMIDKIQKVQNTDDESE